MLNPNLQLLTTFSQLTPYHPIRTRRYRFLRGLVTTEVFT
ncbi:hypothetical protein HMPREF0880_00702 [Yokenella regensburgei ATCC 43003]|nr:hypothetical protein HMPREF0880_00702 [Yokenella regensburgei ATCC 43003]